MPVIEEMMVDGGWEMMNGSRISLRWGRWTPRLQSLLRIVCACMFMQAGMVKLFAFPIGVPPANGTVPLFSEAWFAGFLEVFGGGFILLGLFTRPVTFLVSGEMAVAYFQYHFPRGFWQVANGGVPAVFYCFLWLYFSAAGPGPWSLDALLMKRVQAGSHAGISKPSNGGTPKPVQLTKTT